MTDSQGKGQKSHRSKIHVPFYLNCTQQQNLLCKIRIYVFSGPDFASGPAFIIFPLILVRFCLCRRLLLLLGDKGDRGHAGKAQERLVMVSRSIIQCWIRSKKINVLFYVIQAFDRAVRGGLLPGRLLLLPPRAEAAVVGGGEAGDIIEERGGGVGTQEEQGEAEAARPAASSAAARTAAANAADAAADAASLSLV